MANLQAEARSKQEMVEQLVAQQKALVTREQARAIAFARRAAAPHPPLAAAAAHASAAAATLII
ncbi:hypothetical protein MNEG_15031 [Monoraphidium neglectum]|uniref:Uncharacterized protein n=1 Tax=Monoraphidium neglectum TaxID=145388 RepID=A0A0D2LT55_9CHLO|nr:hypothetical protein MNEG_15031 [Monoraphidium neglectum]KIY92931.1 hypothetical protein MNEG_15031 [Monoraphidium neglectum]|eukprot:XP_013891951.1 hypothetical protein MNEG_15031 [Monoraphidium neglectum]